MKTDAAMVAVANSGAIEHVVDVAVGEKKEADGLVLKADISSLRGVDEDFSIGGVKQKSVRVKGPAAKFIELNHEKVVNGCMCSLILMRASASLSLPMSCKRFLPCLLAVVLTNVGAAATPKAAVSELDPVAQSVAKLLEQGHYSRQRLDDGMSKQLLDMYLRELDPNRMYLLQSDIEEFESKYGVTLDDAIVSGDLSPAREIFARFMERVEARTAKNLKLAEKNYEFDSERTVEVIRKDAPWPKDQAEADRLWRDRVEAELLDVKLSEHALDTPQKVVTRRQTQLLRNWNEMGDEDIVKLFLTSLAQAYDPHSEYLSPSDLENFSISMRLSLVGVGAVLSSEDGYAKVTQVVPGGPADKDGRLRVNDRIAAVAQGDEEFEDVVDMKLDHVVEKIRGNKGTTVRLQVVPSNATDPSKRQIITIQRDKVELTDQEAKAEIVDMKRGEGRVARVGWITLPSFYRDMDKPGGRSTTDDVLALLNRLKQEEVEGLVIDLRSDGGGSLEEAINMTGLFIPKGPVVQSKDPNGKVTVSHDTNPSVAYSGPMVVLINRLSASASEIFAAALQDYGRAVVVGDERTFGKGTVQTMLEMGRIPFFGLGTDKAGALKLTINKFYRVKGGSTQLNGVASDVILPSLTDTPKIGESALENPLPYDEVAPQRIEDSGNIATWLSDLRTRSVDRVGAEPEFKYIQEDVARLRERIESNRISLNLKKRSEEIAEDKKRKELRRVERETRGPALNATAYEVTLSDVKAAALKEVPFDRNRAKRVMEAADDPEAEEESALPDAIRNETLHLAADLIELEKGVRTAAVNPEKPAKP
jgi:carboxyl-terminal processing protease